MKKTIAKYIAGSQSYGLSTPESDTDYRGVYITDDVGLILDPYKYTSSSQKTEGTIEDNVDTMFFELRHFLKILRGCNTNAVEMVFNKRWEECDDVFLNVIANRNRLIDPDKLYKSLKGYIQSELKLALGERTGKLGGKRYAQVQKYGFSPKNFVQLLRLCHAGREFFKTGDFPLDISKYQLLRVQLMEIKCHPERFDKDVLKQVVAVAEQGLDEAYHTHNVANKLYRFDEQVYEQLIMEAYYPVLKRAWHKAKPPFWVRWLKS